MDLRRSSRLAGRDTYANEEKHVTSINRAMTAAQYATDLLEASFPCQLTSLEWRWRFIGGTANDVFGNWFILLLRDGVSVSSATRTDGAAAYQPEQNVLACGGFYGTSNSGGSRVDRVSGSLHPYVDLKVGDKIVMVFDTGGLGSVLGITMATVEM